MEDVDTLLEKTKTSIKNLEKILDFNTYKASNNGLNLILQYRIEDRESPEKKLTSEERDKFMKRAGKLVEDVIFKLEIPTIGAKYSSTEIPYSRLIVEDDISFSNKNSYTMGLEFIQWNEFNGVVSINHRLTIQSLDKKFDEIKVGDTFEIMTNKRGILKSVSTHFIQLNNGDRLYCKVLDTPRIESGDAYYEYSSLQIIEIKKREL